MFYRDKHGGNQKRNSHFDFRQSLKFVCSYHDFHQRRFADNTSFKVKKSVIYYVFTKQFYKYLFK